MSGRRDPLERELPVWLDEEAPRRAPDALRQKVMAAVPETRQRARWWRGGAVRRATPVLGTAMSAAAVVVAAVLMVGLLASAPAIPGVSPSPGSPTPYPVAAAIPGGTNFPVVHAGSVWTPQFEEGTVIRVDIATNEVVATIPVGQEPHAMAAHETGVYVSARDDEGFAIKRIDAQTNEVSGRLPVGRGGWAMTVSGDTLWMTAFDPGRLFRVDLERFEQAEEIRPFPSALGVAADGDHVYAALGGQGTLLYLNAATDERELIATGTETTTIPILTEDEIWLTTIYSGQLVVISRETHEVTDRISLQSPAGIVEHDGLMWVSDFSTTEESADNRVVAIDPETHEITRVLPLGANFADRGIVADGDSLWVITDLGLTRFDLEP